MTTRQRRFSPVDLAIGVATILLAIFVVGEFDRDYLVANPPAPVPQNRRTVTRPEWIWELQYPYTRFQHDFLAIAAAATLGAGAALAIRRETWTRRGLSRPGTVAVALALAIGIVQLSVVLTAKRPMFASARSFWIDLRNNLEFPLPGTVLGAWTVMALLGLWRPSRSGCELSARAVGWAWLANIGLFLGYGLLFG